MAPGEASKISSASDAFLVERSLDGDIPAFETLARRYALLMRSYAARLLSSTSEAEDVVQEALVVAWKTLDSLQDPAKVKTWLMRIVSHKSIDLLRKRKDNSPLESIEPVAAETDSPERRAVAASQLSALSAALSQLPETQRRCWVLRELGANSYQDIAEQLDLSVTAVRGQLARARATLLAEMEEWR